MIMQKYVLHFLSSIIFLGTLLNPALYSDLRCTDIVVSGNYSSEQYDSSMATNVLWGLKMETKETLKEGWE